MNSNQRKKIAIIGIQGVPSKYGGFETLVEHLIEDDSAEFTVFCSSIDQKQSLKKYKNAFGLKAQYPLFHRRAIVAT